MAATLPLPLGTVQTQVRCSSCVKGTGVRIETCWKCKGNPKQYRPPHTPCDECSGGGTLQYCITCNAVQRPAIESNTSGR